MVAEHVCKCCCSFCLLGKARSRKSFSVKLFEKFRHGHRVELYIPQLSLELFGPRYRIGDCYNEILFLSAHSKKMTREQLE